MRKLIVWLIPFLTGVACQIAFSTPEVSVLGRVVFALLLGAIASFVFDMALNAYVVHDILNKTWKVLTTVEPAEDDQV